MRGEVYDRFFELAPAGQEYFIQSATRSSPDGGLKWMSEEAANGALLALLLGTRSY